MKAEITVSGIADAEKLASVLEPEFAEEMSRVTARMLVDGDSLNIKIEAEDVASLRAALNSYLRWLRIAADTQELIGGL